MRLMLLRWFGFACLCGLLLLNPVLAAERIKSVRIWPSPDSTRVVFDLSGAVQYRVLPLQGNIVQLEISPMSSPSLGRMSGESDLIKDIRVQRQSGQSFRLLVELTRPAQAKAFSLAPSQSYGHRLVLDLADSKAESPAPQTTPVATVKRHGGTGRDIVIAIDAGHGGHDPGAVGPRGTYEKHVTMAISERLAALLNQEPGFKAVLTRSADYYIYPTKRPEMARNKQADLLISIHADAVKNRKAHGGSVWVLSLRRATTEVGRMLEQTEQHSELLGGVAEVIKDSANERYLAQTVLDLSMNHSMTTGFEIATKVLAEMGKVTHLHKKEPQPASLGVLKAPDIPSFLVETGFISNPAEEQKLKSASYQQKLAAAIFRALKLHYQQNPPADTWLAQRKGLPAFERPAERQSNRPSVAMNNSAHAVNIKPMQPGPIVRTVPKVNPTAKSGQQIHIVRRGESLSGLAKKYGLPMSVLRSHNRLKSDNIQVGQKLRIPN
jgi:N-acetylmuramoyl-L-alanine amidase